MSVHTKASTRADERSGERVQSVLAYLVMKPWFWLAVIAFPFGWPIYLAVSNKAPDPLPIVGRLPAIAATDERGGSFDTKEIGERAWVMNFVTASDPASRASLESLQRVQRRSAKLGPVFGMVTWVLDPDGDAQAVSTYAKQFKPSPLTWRFVPHATAEVFGAAGSAVSTRVGGPLSEADQAKLRRGNTLFLVDPQSRLRGIYDASDVDSVTLMLHDAGLIINRGY
jgi:cytochrome oxidase Cu insertion factor (SCO1/SenC/PrrC family)